LAFLDSFLRKGGHNIRTPGDYADLCMAAMLPKGIFKRLIKIRACGYSKGTA
jgi:hypothetical protein